MDRATIIATFAMPNMSALAALLRAKDANSTGVDDEVADGIDYVIGRLQNYLNPAAPVPPMPASMVNAALAQVAKTKPPAQGIQPKGIGTGEAFGNDPKRK